MRVVRHGNTKIKPPPAGRVRGVCAHCQAVVDARPEEIARGHPCTLEDGCLVVDCPECPLGRVHFRYPTLPE